MIISVIKTVMTLPIIIYLLIFFDFFDFFIWLDGQSWGDAELVREQLRGFLKPWGMHRAK